MKIIKVIKNEEWNWYKIGDKFIIKDESKYSIGVQVFADGPDVVQHGHYEYEV